MKGPHPYEAAPDYRRWRSSVAGRGAGEVDPVVGFPIRVRRQDKVVTAGSCFAQHISGRLSQGGYNFLVTETAHPILGEVAAAAAHYGLFSARFGNLYTSRQLLQLLHRAYGRFEPADEAWRDGDCWFDPFRPQIQPGGFSSLEEFRRDRVQHLAAVRRAFEEMDVFIFTLGLTEYWFDRRDGAAYPVCPGTAAGEFDPGLHAFANLTASEVEADMRAFIDELRLVNPAVRIILTVSPVPLAATARDIHVLTATTYSKAVLRVAAEALTSLPNVAYFPSFEIITGAAARGAYFDDDLRSVTEAGVDEVMRRFFQHAADETSPDLPKPKQSLRYDRSLALSKEVINRICDEELLSWKHKEE